MLATLSEVRSKYDHAVSLKQVYARQIEVNQAELDSVKTELDNVSKAKVFLQTVVDEAQGEIKADMDGLVTMAVRTIFGDSYRFDLQIDRQSTNAPYKPVVWESIDGVEYEYTPKDEMGGSMMDPIAFIIRVVLRSLEAEPCRNAFWLDEPMKNMGKGQLLANAGAMLREVSHSLGLQLIIITHEPELAEMGDKVYYLRRTKGVTQTVDKNPAPQSIQPPRPKKQKRTL